MKWLLEEKLPYIYSKKSAFSGSHWRLADPKWKEHVEDIGNIIDDPGLLPKKDFFKNKPRRRIFCFNISGADKIVLVKGFTLERWRNRRQYKKYAFSEATHLLMARERGLPVPTVFGYGERYQKGILRWVAVMMEFIPFPRMMDSFILGMTEHEIWESLQRSIPLFEKLYRTGCNHVDFSPTAIMRSPDNAEDDKIIDFQYCSFLDSPSPSTLASQLGFFGWVVVARKDWVKHDMREQWYVEALKALDIPLSDRIFSIIRENEKNRRTVSERLEGHLDVSEKH